MADDEPVASKTRSQTAEDEPIAARRRQALGSHPEMSVFANVKTKKTLNEWIHEIVFVTSTMSDPDEPQSFQEACWDPDLVAREKWQEAICLEFKKMFDMGVWRHVKSEHCPNDCRLVGCRVVFKGEKEWCVLCQTCGKRFQPNPWCGFYRQLLPSG